MCKSVFVHVGTCVCACVCVGGGCVCVCVCVCVREREGDRTSPDNLPVWFSFKSSQCYLTQSATSWQKSVTFRWLSFKVSRCVISMY